MKPGEIGPLFVAAVVRSEGKVCLQRLRWSN